MKGIYRKPFGAAEGDSVFTCDRCGSEALTAYYHKNLFYLRCMNCGADHTEAIFG
jgi:transcription elongation factor Elf1